MGRAAQSYLAAFGHILQPQRQMASFSQVFFSRSVTRWHWLESGDQSLESRDWSLETGVWRKNARNSRPETSPVTPGTRGRDKRRILAIGPTPGPTFVRGMLGYWRAEVKSDFRLPIGSAFGGSALRFEIGDWELGGAGRPFMPVPPSPSHWTKPLRGSVGLVSDPVSSLGPPRDPVRMRLACPLVR